jgi:hypothetical protein
VAASGKRLLVGTPGEHWLVSLGAVPAGEVAGPDPNGIWLLFSVGLAGTEAFLLDRLAASIETVHQQPSFSGCRSLCHLVAHRASVRRSGLPNGVSRQLRPRLRRGPTNRRTRGRS